MRASGRQGGRDARPEKRAPHAGQKRQPSPSSQRDGSGSDPRKRFKAAGGDAKRADAKPFANKPGGGKPFNKPGGAKPFAKPGGSKISPRPDGAKPFTKRPAGDKGKEGEARSKLSKREKKELLRARRARKPNYDVISSLNKLWTSPFAHLPRAERVARVEEILRGSKGKIAAVANRHDASRVFQSMIKYGSQEQRQAIMDELATHMNELARDKYGQWAVLKLLQYGSKQAQRTIFAELLPHAAQLATHSHASRVLDLLYAQGSRRERAALIERLFGKEYVALRKISDPTGESAPPGADGAHDGDVLAAALAMYPEQRLLVLTGVWNSLEKLLEKELIGFRFSHALLLSYLHQCGYEERLKLLTRVQEHVPQLFHSRSGSRVLMMALSLGNAKTRKLALRALRDHVDELAVNEFGHMVLVRALDVVDDTVLLAKSVCEPLVAALPLLATHRHGSKPLLHVLAPGLRSVFYPQELSELEPAFADVKGEDGSVQRVPTSKKAPELRRKELLAHLLPPLLTFCSANMDHLLRNARGSIVVCETLRCAALDAAAVPADAFSDALRQIAALVREEAQEAAAPAELVAAGKLKVAGGDEDEEEEDEEEEKEKEKEKKAKQKAANGKDTMEDEEKEEAEEEEEEEQEEEEEEEDEEEDEEDGDGGAKEKKDSAAAGQSGPPVSVLEDIYAHHAVKRLLLGLGPAAQQFAALLTDRLLAVSKSRLQHFAATNRSAFVLAAVLEAAAKPVADKLRAALKPMRAALEKEQAAGCVVLLRALSGVFQKREAGDEPRKAQPAKKQPQASKASEPPKQPATKPPKQVPKPAAQPAQPAQPQRARPPKK